AVTGDVKIREAIIVIITNGNSHTVISVCRICQSRLLGNISEAAIFILTEEPIPVARVLAIKVLRNRHRVSYTSAVYQENIQQSIIVVIEKGDTPGHGFDQVFLRSGRIFKGKVHSTRELHLENC